MGGDTGYNNLSAWTSTFVLQAARRYSTDKLLLQCTSPKLVFLMSYEQLPVSNETVNFLSRV